MNEEMAKTQQAVARICDDLKVTLLQKNRAYGNSAGQKPVLVPGITPTEALMVRMSDKVGRIGALMAGAPDNGEPLRDSVKDLAGYCVLWLAADEARAEAETKRRLREEGVDPGMMTCPLPPSL